MIRSVIYEHTNFCLPHHVLRMHTLCALVEGKCHLNAAPLLVKATTQRSIYRMQTLNSSKNHSHKYRCCYTES